MNTPRTNDSTDYQLLKELEQTPTLSQRDLARRLGISLGKINFCLKALVDKGCLKVNNFKNSENKIAYAYFLTPRGVDEKARMTVTFLKYKMVEYDRLRTEIEQLQLEVEQQGLIQESPSSEIVCDRKEDP
jgi:EPS-associated MarR family transcriptional regulator